MSQQTGRVKVYFLFSLSRSQISQSYEYNTQQGLDINSIQKNRNQWYYLFKSTKTIKYDSAHNLNYKKRIMYGRNNIFGSNNSSNNNSSYNNNSSNNNNSYNRNYGNNGSSNYNNNPTSNYPSSNNYSNNQNNYSNNRNNDRIGTYRTSYKCQQPPGYLTSIIEHWKQYPPHCITSREELLHLSPIETRVEDYFLIRNKQLNSLHDEKLKDAIRKDCFNEQLLKNSCYNLMPFSFEYPYSTDAIKAMAKRPESGYGTSNNYGNNNSNYNSNNTYGNNNNSYGNNSGNNNSSYNTRGNNIFSSNNNNNNGNNSSTNIFSRNSNNSSGNSASNNIFSNNSANNNNSSNNNFSGSNNIFSRNSNNNNNNNNSNNNSYGSNGNNNIFSNNNNNSNNNSSNNNIFSSHNNNSGSSLFNNNNSASNNIFNNNNNNNNNNGNSNNNIFSNNGSRNIFNNNNNNNGNNNIFSNNNNNGNNMFNNGNNTYNNGSLFNNNSNYSPYNQPGVLDPHFFTNLQVYMKNVNEVVRKLNGQVPQPSYNTPSQPSGSHSIFASAPRAYESFDPYEIESYVKKKHQEQEVFVSVRNDDRLNNGSRISNNRAPSTIEDVNRSQAMENSQIGGQRLKTSYINHSRMNGSSITVNEVKGSKIRSNQTHFEKKQPENPMSISNINKSNCHYNADPQHEESMNIKKSRLFHEVYDAPCECQLKLIIIWKGIDPKRCEMLPDILATTLKLDRLIPNRKDWRENIVRALKNEHPIVRIDAQLIVIDVEPLEGGIARFIIKGELHQHLFNFDSKEYDVFYRNVKKGIAYNLSISNQFGQVSWDFPVDITNLDFAEGGEFSIENNAIICEKEVLNYKCHVVFRRLPDKIKAIIVKEGGDTTNAKRTLDGWVSKISDGKFQLDEIWVDERTDETGWSMIVSKFL